MDFPAHRRQEHGLTPLNENLRQIVYGGSDGIVTTFAVVAGFAGAGAEGAAQLGTLAVILFGLANLFADATSMGLGEFLSSRSQQQVYLGTKAEEEVRLEEDPAGERAEVMAILAARDIRGEDAVRFVAELEKHPALMADFMMRYEFGMADPEDQNPAVNGLITFASFLVFGVLPLIPYFLMPPVPGTFFVSLWATGGALLLLGLLRWRSTGEPIWRAVGETLLVGGVCAAVAYAVGLIVVGA